MKIRTSGVAFMLVLGAMAALPPISIDMALPALTLIGTAYARYRHDTDHRQLL